jgi:hypothetical protein
MNNDLDETDQDKTSKNGTQNSGCSRNTRLIDRFSSGDMLLPPPSSSSSSLRTNKNSNISSSKSPPRSPIRSPETTFDKPKVPCGYLKMQHEHPQDQHQQPLQLPLSSSSSSEQDGSTKKRPAFVRSNSGSDLNQPVRMLSPEQSAFPKKKLSSEDLPSLRRRREYMATAGRSHSNPVLEVYTAPSKAATAASASPSSDRSSMMTRTPDSLSGSSEHSSSGIRKKSIMKNTMMNQDSLSGGSDHGSSGILRKSIMKNSTASSGYNHHNSNSSASYSYMSNHSATMYTMPSKASSNTSPMSHRNLMALKLAHAGGGASASMLK